MKKLTRKEAAQAAIYSFQFLAFVGCAWWWIEQPTRLAAPCFILSVLGSNLALKLTEKIGGAA